MSKRTPANKKHLRQSVTRNQRNRTYKSNIRTAIKELDAATDPAAKEKSLRKVSATLDKAAARNVLHRNKAARLKSQLARKANAPKTD